MALPPMAQWKTPFRKAGSMPVCFNVMGQPCVEKKFDALWKLPDIFAKERIIMTGCCHNEYVGLRSRMLKDMPNRYNLPSKLLNHILDELGPMFNENLEQPVSLQHVVEGMPGDKRQRYYNTCDKVWSRGGRSSDWASCDAFVKTEVYSALKAPRIIMNVNPEFNMWFAKYVEPLEHALCKLPFVAKGRNYQQRGEQFKDRIEGAAAIEGDCNRCEASQSSEFIWDTEGGLVARLNWSHSDIAAYHFGLKQSDVKKGVTSDGCHFHFKGCVGSGIRSTGFGTSLRVIIACRAYEILNKTGVFYNFVVDGDDNIIKVPHGFVQKYDTFALCGFDAELIYREDYHDIEFCSGKFIKANSGGDYLFMQNIHKLINNAAVVKKVDFQHKGVHFATLAQMYEKVYGDFPIIRSMVECMRRNSKGSYMSRRIMNQLNPSLVAAFDSKPNTIKYDSTVYAEICMSFDLNYGEVNWLENWFSKVDMELQPKECKRLRSHTLKDTGQRTKEFYQTVDDLLANDSLRGRECWA